MSKDTVQITRSQDYKYDPLYQVSGEKDLLKQAYRASVDNAQVDISPVFQNMFSELANHSRNCIVLRNNLEIESGKLWEQKQMDIAQSGNTNPADISGADRAKFFKMPIISLSGSLLGENEQELRRQQTAKLSKIVETSQIKGTQTMYRESSAQTKPWKTTHYKLMDDEDPEILKLNFLKDHLPAGVHEVDLILQARRKRAWEKLLPEVEGVETLNQRRQILEAIELDEWVFREEEIDYLQMMRLELLEKMLAEFLVNTFTRTENKLYRIGLKLQKQRVENLKKIHHQKERELRRLYRSNFGINTKYQKVNVIDEHVDHKSELYGPLMRYGENPKRFHMIIKQTYQPVMYGIEEFSTLPRWLFKSKLINANNIKLPGRRLCIRETKWTEPVLKQLHHELTTLRKCMVIKCTLRKRKVKEEVLDDTVKVSTIPEEQLEEYAAAVTLQSIVRGRATQTLIYEGRDRCRELIEELQSTHALVMAQKEDIRKKRKKVLGQQRISAVKDMKKANIEEILNKLEGSIVGTMLDFLNKELVRIMDERKAHALALLYERERRDREAAEAGRRQVEERRRKEHDEMFKQVVKVHQDTVDVYLRDVILEGMDHVSHENAYDYIEKLTEQIKDREKNEPTRFLEKEVLIADMICHFIIPEVEKQNLRDRIKENQRKHLRCAHDAIYKKIEKLPKTFEYECNNEYLHENSVKSELPSLPENIVENDRIPSQSVEQVPTGQMDNCIQVPEINPNVEQNDELFGNYELIGTCDVF